MTKENLIELIAETIYHTRYQEIDEVVNQGFHKLWKSPDTHCIIDDFVLAEFERDDYRHEARDVLKVVLENFKSIEEMIIKDIIE